MGVARSAGRAFARVAPKSWRNAVHNSKWGRSPEEPKFTGDNHANFRVGRNVRDQHGRSTREEYDLIVTNKGDSADIHMARYSKGENRTKYKYVETIGTNLTHVGIADPTSGHQTSTYKASGGTYTGVNAVVKHLQTQGFDVRALNRKGVASGTPTKGGKLQTGTSQFFGQHIDPVTRVGTANVENRYENYMRLNPVSEQQKHWRSQKSHNSSGVYIPPGPKGLPGPGSKSQTDSKDPKPKDPVNPTDFGNSDFNDLFDLKKRFKYPTEDKKTRGKPGQTFGPDQSQNQEKQEQKPRKEWRNPTVKQKQSSQLTGTVEPDYTDVEFVDEKQQANAVEARSTSKQLGMEPRSSSREWRANIKKPGMTETGSAIKNPTVPEKAETRQIEFAPEATLRERSHLLRDATLKRKGFKVDPSKVEDVTKYNGPEDYDRIALSDKLTAAINELAEKETNPVHKKGLQAYAHIVSTHGTHLGHQGEILQKAKEDAKAAPTKSEAQKILREGKKNAAEVATVWRNSKDPQGHGVYAVWSKRLGRNAPEVFTHKVPTGATQEDIAAFDKATAQNNKNLSDARGIGLKNMEIPSRWSNLNATAPERVMGQIPVENPRTEFSDREIFKDEPPTGPLFEKDQDDIDLHNAMQGNDKLKGREHFAFEPGVPLKASQIWLATHTQEDYPHIYAREIAARLAGIHGVAKSVSKIGQDFSPSKAGEALMSGGDIAEGVSGKAQYTGNKTSKTRLYAAERDADEARNEMFRKIYGSLMERKADIEAEVMKHPAKKRSKALMEMIDRDIAGELFGHISRSGNPEKDTSGYNIFTSGIKSNLVDHQLIAKLSGILNPSKKAPSATADANALPGPAKTATIADMVDLILAGKHKEAAKLQFMEDHPELDKATKKRIKGLSYLERSNVRAKMAELGIGEPKTPVTDAIDELIGGRDALQQTWNFAVLQDQQDRAENRQAAEHFAGVLADNPSSPIAQNMAAQSTNNLIGMNEDVSGLNALPFSHNEISKLVEPTNRTDQAAIEQNLELPHSADPDLPEHIRNAVLGGEGEAYHVESGRKGEPDRWYLDDGDDVYEMNPDTGDISVVNNEDISHGLRKAAESGFIKKYTAESLQPAQSQPVAETAADVARNLVEEHDIAYPKAQPEPEAEAPVDEQVDSHLNETQGAVEDAQPEIESKAIRTGSSKKRSFVHAPEGSLLNRVGMNNIRLGGGGEDDWISGLTQSQKAMIIGKGDHLDSSDQWAHKLGMSVNEFGEMMANELSGYAYHAKKADQDKRWDAQVINSSVKAGKTEIDIDHLEPGAKVNLGGKGHQEEFEYLGPFYGDSRDIDITKEEANELLGDGKEGHLFRDGDKYGLQVVPFENPVVKANSVTDADGNAIEYASSAKKPGEKVLYKGEEWVVESHDFNNAQTTLKKGKKRVKVDLRGLHPEEIESEAEQAIHSDDEGWTAF